MAGWNRPPRGPHRTSTTGVTVHRIPGEGRYAHAEREQRWLLPELPDGLTDAASIVDRYLVGTRLRLRSVTADGATTYKLGQKVRPEPDSPAIVKLTNIYLSGEEYEVLRALRGRDLRKTRWRSVHAAGRLVVDEFSDPLTGLVLAELELRPGEVPKQVDVLAVDVSEDDRFSGGRLAGLSAADAAALRAEVDSLLRTI
jgi:CYTH domain-containing protein